jgi:hypothetical protein
VGRTSPCHVPSIPAHLAVVVRLGSALPRTSTITTQLEAATRVARDSTRHQRVSEGGLVSQHYAIRLTRTVSLAA